MIQVYCSYTGEQGCKIIATYCEVKTVVLLVNNYCQVILKLTHEQVTLDGWVLGKLRERLRKASIIASRTHRPVVLYRHTIEEMDQSAEEEIATVNEQYVVVQVITHGGFIPPNFPQQYF